MREGNNLFFARRLASEFPKIDVAAAYQHVLEIVATAYVRHYVRDDRRVERRLVRRRCRKCQAESENSPTTGCREDIHPSQHG